MRLQNEPAISIRRVLAVSAVFFVFYVLVVFRLWQEQILQESYHDTVIARQSVRRIRIPAPRGRIFTEDGAMLAGNSPVYNIVFHLQEMRQPGRASKTIDFMLSAAERAAAAIGREHSLTPESIQTHMNYTPALPMTVFENLDEIELAKISEIPEPVPGMEVVTEPQREYYFGSMAAHIIGFVRKDDPKSAKDREDFFYYIPDETGKDGMEKVYDSSIPESYGAISGLRGTAGSSLVMVDYRGIIHKTLGNSVPERIGHDIVLTINSRAQALAEGLLADKPGAIVLLDAGSGAVLAMASSPSYDISRFVPQLSPSYWGTLNSNPDRPMFNRATLGEYEPGSIIKPIIGLSLLEHGMPPEERINCPGRSFIGDASIRCANRSGHGNLDLVGAIEQSCNVFFIEEGRVAGLEKLADTLASFGVGKMTGIPIAERPGLLPSRSELYHRTGRRWNVFETALISIGQGNLRITPLQAALFTAAIANGGTLWRPYLLKEVLDPGGNVIFINQPCSRADLNIRRDFLDIIRNGMFQSVHSSRGSGRAAKTPVIELYGKTGTAEVGHGESRRKNAWFIAFGEHSGRTYATAVFIEDGVSGGKTCAPVAKQFFDSWLD
ncbi:MAG: hypothetical protein JW808_08960 [Victivallales bacterium]|nr:hypothetical protein [Victivallales bacterium]